MTHDEIVQRNIEEFSRLQDYMQDVEKTSTVYQKMKKRYIELKVILASSGINVALIDYINE